MKTKSQIIDWLKNKPFELAFYKNCAFNQVQFNKDFILSAFKWASSPEGWAYWKNVNDKFIKWYYSLLSIDEYPFIKELPVSSNRTFSKLATFNKLCIIRDSIADNNARYSIRFSDDKLHIIASAYKSGGLSFNTFEDATNFFNTYSKELEEVKEYL